MSGFVACPTRFRADDDKLRLYLLNPDHPDGGSKCAFLPSVGFSVDDPLTLMAALVRHPTPDTLTRAYSVPYGLRYHFEGPMTCPNGSVASLRSVWQVDADGDPSLARLITLKPLRRRGKAR